MATVFTSNLRLALPTAGTESGTWGDTVNNGITTLIDTAISGTATVTMTAADYTLTTASGSTDEARAMFIKLTGSPGLARNVICPTVSKLYFVFNNTTGGFAQTFKTSAGTGISVPNGSYMALYCDGTNIVNAFNTVGSLTIGSSGETNSGNYTFTGTGNRITGDFSNATDASRVAVQSSTTNGNTTVGFLPNGTGTVASFALYSNSSTTNASRFRTYIQNGADAAFVSDITGSGSYLPMTFYTGGSERMRIDTAGAVSITGTLSASGTVTAAGTYLIAKDISSYSALSNGGFIGIQGLDSTSTNNNQLVIQGYSKAAQTADVVFKLGYGGSVFEALRLVGGPATCTLDISASCGQIKFPATQIPSADVNTLDDYEEGPWTPTQGGNLVVVGTFSSSGTYTKVGNQVFIRGQVNGSTSVAIAANGAIFGGLPFTAVRSIGSATNSGLTVASVVFVEGTVGYSGGGITATPSIIFSAVYTV